MAQENYYYINILKVVLASMTWSSDNLKAIHYAWVVFWLSNHQEWSAPLYLLCDFSFSIRRGWILSYNITIIEYTPHVSFTNTHLITALICTLSYLVLGRSWQTEGCEPREEFHRFESTCRLKMAVFNNEAWATLNTSWAQCPPHIVAGSEERYFIQRFSRLCMASKL